MSSHSKTRYIVLDTWRGIAAIFVAMLHFKYDSYFTRLDFFGHAFLFVDFFFVLSGFVITHNYGVRLTSRRDLYLFAQNRFARLWPLHFFTLILFLLFLLAKAFLSEKMNLSIQSSILEGPNYFSSFIANFFLVQSLPGVHGMNLYNGPSWSISVEFYTYFIFALLVLWRASEAIYVGIILISIGVIFAFSPSYIETYEYGLFRCLFSFLIGRYIYIYVSSNLFNVNTFHEVLTVLFMVIFVATAGFSWVNMFAPIVFGLVVLVFSQGKGWVSRWLGHPKLTQLGALSYSIYMMHYIILLLIINVINVLERKFNWHMESVAFAGGNVQLSLSVIHLGYVLFVVLVSFLTYRYLELPAQYRLRVHKS